MKLFMIVLCVLFFGCIGSAQRTSLDWNYLDGVNDKALNNFLDDVMNDQYFAAPEDKGCMRSWKGNYNCTNYGLPLWVLTESIRTNNQRGFQWLADHVRHITNYGYDWEKHIPGGEGTRKHPVNEGENNWDSDWLRHVHLGPYCALFYEQRIPLTILERARLLRMIIDWADNWYMKIDWYHHRDTGRLFMYGRGLIPALGLINTYYITQDYKYFMAAEYIFVNMFYKLERKLANGFYSYDVGYEDENRVSELLYFSAHMDMSPWQLSYLGEVALNLYCHSKNEVVKQLCLEVILRITDWIVKPNRPKGDLFVKNDGMMGLSFLQGGSLMDLYDRQFDPMTALAMDSAAKFLPLTLLKSLPYDGKFYHTLLPNNKERITYPRNELGPHVSHDMMAGWADNLLCRYLITRDPNDLAWCQWILRDAKYFQNRSSAWDLRTLAKPDWQIYGAGNIGRTRGMAWYGRMGLMARYWLHIMYEEGKTGQTVK